MQFFAWIARSSVAVEVTTLLLPSDWTAVSFATHGKRNMYRKQTTLWFLGILTLILLGCAFVITRPFLYPFVAATILAVVFYPAHQRILGWTKGKSGKASLLSTLALLFLFAVPVLSPSCWSHSKLSTQPST